MGLYWKSIIVKATGCDYQIAGRIEKLIDELCPNCSEAELMREAPIALRALSKLDTMSQDIFNKTYDKLSVDEFCDFYESFKSQRIDMRVRHAA